MIEPKDIDELVRRLAEAVPSGVREAQRDLESNFRSVLQGAFARMDLVTREEFDAQNAVLARTREKIEALSQQLEELEQALKSGAMTGDAAED